MYEVSTMQCEGAGLRLKMERGHTARAEFYSNRECGALGATVGVQGEAQHTGGQTGRAWQEAELYPALNGVW